MRIWVCRKKNGKRSGSNLSSLAVFENANILYLELGVCVFVCVCARAGGYMWFLIGHVHGARNEPRAPLRIISATELPSPNCLTSSKRPNLSPEAGILRVRPGPPAPASSEKNVLEMQMVWKLWGGAPETCVSADPRHLCSPTANAQTGTKLARRMD